MADIHVRVLFRLWEHESWGLFQAEQHQDFYNNSAEVSSKKLDMVSICLF